MNFNCLEDGAACFTMPRCGSDDIDNHQEFECDRTEQVNRHRHIVRHQHDIINEYDVVHEHDFNYFDVVTERDVVRHNDFTTHRPDYCNERQGCICPPFMPTMPIMPRASTPGRGSW